jgi:hypothetical protein
MTIEVRGQVVEFGHIHGHPELDNRFAEGDDASDNMAKEKNTARLEKR